MPDSKSAPDLPRLRLAVWRLQEKWDLEFCGLPEGDKVMAGRDLGRSGANTARVEITEQGNLFFGGAFPWLVMYWTIMPCLQMPHAVVHCVVRGLVLVVMSQARALFDRTVHQRLMPVACAKCAGNLPSRGAYAEVGADITSRLPKGDSRTAGTEGLSLRLRGDGHSYTCILRCAGGHRYAARFPTRNGYMTVRLPFATFRPEGPNQPALSPENVEHMTIRYDHRRAAAAAPAAPAAAIQPGTPMTPATAAAAVTAGSANLNAQRFDMEIDWIKVRRRWLSDAACLARPGSVALYMNAPTFSVALVNGAGISLAFVRHAGFMSAHIIA